MILAIANDLKRERRNVEYKDLNDYIRSDVTMTRKQSWRRYERKKAKAHHGKPVGGPGRCDYVRGDICGEVKNWQRPVDRTTVRELAQKGVREIVSKSGFTKPAIEYVKTYRSTMKLFRKNKRVA